jgi:predicted RNase H-like HicB family nuclease
MSTIKQKFTVIIEREDEDNGYVSLCPELDIASQGDSIEEAKKNLKEAIELFLEFAAPSEIGNSLKSEIQTWYHLLISENNPFFTPNSSL